MPDLVVVSTPLRRWRAARRLCDAQGGLLLGPRVVTPRSLVPGLLAGAGEARVLLAPLAERLMALAAAHDAGLAPAGPAGGGAARAAVALIADLRRGEVTAADARAAAAEVGGRPGERLRVASSALEAYEERLSARGALDGAAATRAAAGALARGATSEESRDLGLLVLEGFLPTDPAVLDLVAGLATGARRVLARVPYRPEDPARSTAAEPWVRRLESLHELTAGREVEVSFPEEPPPTRRVVGLAAASDDEQAEGAARLAGELVDGGMDAGDIAVVAPRRLVDRLARTFRQAGVPLSAGASVPLSALPLVTDLRAALGSAERLGREEAELLLASACLRLAPAPPGLGLLLDRAGALPGRGDPEDRLRARAGALSPAGRGGAEREALLRAADAVGEVRRAVAPLAGEARPRQWAARVRALLDRAGARRRAARGEAGVARRDLLALARLDELLDELVAALAVAGRGDELLGSAGWASLLEVGLGLAEVGGAPEPAAGAVEVWGLEDAPGLTARAVLVLGAERGAWPGTPPDDPFLGEAARAALNRHLRRRAVPGAASRQAQAELAAISAIAAGREVLAVGWTSGPEGVGPAALAGRALGAEPPQRPVDPPLARSRVLVDVLRAAARAARDGDPRPLLGGPPDLRLRAGSVAARGALERERRDAWMAGRASPWAGKLEGAAAVAWQAALPAEWSASHLETHARCPYRFFLGVAGLRERDECGLDIARGDEGSLLHAALEGFLRARRDRGAWPLRGAPEEREEARRVAGEVLDRFAAEGRAGDPAAWTGKRESLLRRLERWLASEVETHAGLVPTLLEHRFGGGAEAPPVVVPTPGGEIRLQGRIDRVDAGPGRLLVLDYKDSRDGKKLRGRLAPEAMGVESFQVPLYVLAAAQALPGHAEIAATYALLRSAERLPPWTVPAGDGFLALGEARRAEVRAAGGRTFADAVVEGVGRARSGELPIAPRDCTGCPFGAVCRFPERGEA